MAHYVKTLPPVSETSTAVLYLLELHFYFFFITWPRYYSQQTDSGFSRVKSWSKQRSSSCFRVIKNPYISECYSLILQMASVVQNVNRGSMSVWQPFCCAIVVIIDTHTYWLTTPDQKTHLIHTPEGDLKHYMIPVPGNGEKCPRCVKLINY